MRGSLSLGVLTLLLASLAPAQRPRDEDVHERLALRLQQTISAQKQVLEDIKTLLQESVRNNRNMEAERVRLEMKADFETLRAELARQGAEVKLLQKDLETEKAKVENVEIKNRMLEAETDNLRSEIATQALHRQRLQQEVRELKTLLDDEKKKNKNATPKPKPDGGKKNG